MLASFLEMALKAVRQPAPYQWTAFVTDASGSRQGSASVAELFPAFHCAYDWHSCVHGHWTLVRLLRLSPTLPLADEARHHLASNLTTERLQGELRSFQRPEYKSFERPYGLAWVCALAAELSLWDDAMAAGLARAVAPLATMASERIIGWHQRLPYPVQSGEHSQSAFGLGLVRDYAAEVGATKTLSTIDAEIERLYACPGRSILHAEPSGHDFLSPSLGRAELVGRMMTGARFASWLSAFIPELTAHVTAEAWLPPARGHVASDGKLSHLIGLNLSRAWMLKRMAGQLPPTDGRVSVLARAASLHSEAGLAAISAEHFESSHWLATFATYALSVPSEVAGES